jgi:hypothetical protein
MDCIGENTMADFISLEKEEWKPVAQFQTVT